MSTRKPLRSTLGIIAVCVALGFVATGCGSSNTATSSKTPTVAPGSSQKLQAMVATLQNPAVSIGITTPISKPAPTGKKIAVLSCPIGCENSQNGITAAAKALGWSVQMISSGNTLQQAEAAFTQAILSKPDGIVILGFSYDLLKPQMQQAKAAGIPVVGLGFSTPPVAPVIANTDGVPTLTAQCKALAYKVAQDGGGKNVHVQFMSDPSYPIVGLCGQTLKETLGTVCAGCSVDISNIVTATIGTTLPSNIVGLLRGNPSANYLVLGYDAMATGLPAALKTSGLPYPKILGLSPTAQDYANIAAGTEFATVVANQQISGWTSIDALARHFVGDSTDVDTNTAQPTQIITRNNLPTDPAYQTPSDFAKQFKKLWLLK